MYKLYTITNVINGKQYFGITKTTLKQRWSMHKFASKSGKHYLACAMRSYGVENFKMELVKEFLTVEECCEAEKQAIATNSDLYNLAVGGQTGFSMRKKSREEYEAWKASLRKARHGRKPAEGMKHSEENKQLFSNVSNAYWDTQDKYDAEKILSLRCCDAMREFGISKTHYYRLRKASNE